MSRFFIFLVIVIVALAPLSGCGGGGSELSALVNGVIPEYEQPDSLIYGIVRSSSSAAPAAAIDEKTSAADSPLTAIRKVVLTIDGKIMTLAADTDGFWMAKAAIASDTSSVTIAVEGMTSRISPVRIRKGRATGLEIRYEEQSSAIVSCSTFESTKLTDASFLTLDNAAVKKSYDEERAALNSATSPVTEISGFVKTQSGAAPAVATSVSIGGNSAAAEADGWFKITGLSLGAGIHKLIVSGAGYSTAEITFSVTARDLGLAVSGLTVTLAKITGTPVSLTLSPGSAKISLGMAFNLAGVTGTVLYNNGERTAALLKWFIDTVEIESQIALPTTGGITKYQARYADDGIELSADFNLEAYPALDSIAAFPDAFTLETGTSLNLGKIDIYATDTTGHRYIVKPDWFRDDLLIENGLVMSEKPDLVVCVASYSEDGITRTAEVKINFKAGIIGLSFTPSTGEVSAGRDFDLSKVVVKANYSDGTSAEVGCEWMEYGVLLENTTISKGTAGDYRFQAVYNGTLKTTTEWFTVSVVPLSFDSLNVYGKSEFYIHEEYRMVAVGMNLLGDTVEIGEVTWRLSDETPFAAIDPKTGVLTAGAMPTDAILSAIAASGDMESFPCYFTIKAPDVDPEVSSLTAISSGTDSVRLTWMTEYPITGATVTAVPTFADNGTSETELTFTETLRPAGTSHSMELKPLTASEQTRTLSGWKFTVTYYTTSGRFNSDAIFKY
jgi:hypothetical protein